MKNMKNMNMRVLLSAAVVAVVSACGGPLQQETGSPVSHQQQGLDNTNTIVVPPAPVPDTFATTSKPTIVVSPLDDLIELRAPGQIGFEDSHVYRRGMGGDHPGGCR